MYLLGENWQVQLSVFETLKRFKAHCAGIFRYFGGRFCQISNHTPFRARCVLVPAGVSRFWWVQNNTARFRSRTTHAVRYWSVLGSTESLTVLHFSEFLHHLISSQKVPALENASAVVSACLKHHSKVAKTNWELMWAVAATWTQRRVHLNAGYANILLSASHEATFRKHRYSQSAATFSPPWRFSASCDKNQPLFFVFWTHTNLDKLER